jgi:type II secretory pathway component PulJ
VESAVLSKASADNFKTYADRIRAKANAIQLDAILTTVIGRVHETLANTKAWISYAQKQMERVPELQARYLAVENKMSGLVARERSTANEVDRSQISVAVSQGQVTADNWDLQVDSTWQQILDEAATLDKNYSKIEPDCAFLENDLRIRGASQMVLGRWRGACQIFSPAKEEAVSSFRVIVQARAKLKTIQNDAHKRRQALVDEAGRLAK